MLLRIPATRLMLPVIEQLLREGMNVNATLVSSPSVYNQVFDCYLRGLESQTQAGELVSNAVCFASIAIGQLDAAIHPLIAYSESSFGMMQSRLLHEHYQRCQHVGKAFPRETRWRSLPEGIQPPRLVWDCTNILPESAWRYLQALATPETVLLLEPATLERYRGVSLLPVSWTNSEQAEQLVASSLSEIALDERVDQFVNEEIMRSLNAFQQ